MKYLAATVSIVACIGFIAATLAQEGDYFKSQDELMKCSPPKFMLVADVDMHGKTLTGMLTKEKDNPERDLFGYHMTFKLSEIKVTNARRVAVDEAELSALKGKLVVLYDGKEPLSALYMGLFREETTIVSFHPVAK